MEAERKSEVTGKVLTLETLNPNVRGLIYPIRSDILLKVMELKLQLSEGAKFAFTEVIDAVLGDMQANGQQPITFIRQVLALITYPPLMDDPKIPSDVKQRAKDILSGCRGYSPGSYTDARGLEVVRRQVAKFIEKRDSYPSNSEHIFLTAGVSGGVRLILNLLSSEINGKTTGVLCPVPGFPLYKLYTTECGLEEVHYNLNEDKGCTIEREELERALEKGKQRCVPRAIVVINPGNPTGHVLKKSNIEEVIRFAYERRLIILADEVYQENIHFGENRFHSFKKTMMGMGPPYSGVELISFMSSSKGIYGECGVKGGYCEVVNIDPQVMHVLPQAAFSLSASIHGQAAVYCFTNPPQQGEPSYELFMSEKTSVLKELSETGKMVQETLSRMPGIYCSPIQGAIYAFPRIEFPPKAIQAAIEMGMTPCCFYAKELLVEKGVGLLPGSYFNQKEGTYHLRFTLLTDKARMKRLLQKLEEFHTSFIEKYN